VDVRRGIIAIDGPAGSGKSTAARGLAERFGFVHLDSGAIYRCITFTVIRHEIPFDDVKRIVAMAYGLAIEFQRDTNGDARVILNGIDRTQDIRTDRVDRKVAQVSAHAGVREVVNMLLHRLAHEGGVVCDGRDIGTHVFPEAHAKFYLDADIAERARRRGKTPESIARRDHDDQERACSPLERKPGVYIEIDTTGLSPAETLNKLHGHCEHLLPR
jgi:cytidylate kinase